MMNNLASSLVVMTMICAIGCSDGDTAAGPEPPNGCQVKLAGEFYMGALLPYTGEWTTGLGFERGIMTAVKEINDQGGIDGPSVGLITCNTDGDKTVGTDIMKQLAPMPEIGAIIGPCRSVVAIGADMADTAAAHEAIKAKTLMLSPSATSPLIADLEDDGYVFRTTVSDAVQGIILARIAEREGFKRVFVVQKDRDAYTQGIREEFIKNFDNGADQVADHVTFNIDDPDFVSTVLAAADDFEAEAVLISAFTTNGAAIIRAADHRTWSTGAKPRWLVPDVLKEDALINKVGANALLEGILGTAPAAPTGPDYATFAANHKVLFGDEPGVFAANAYDAAYLIAGAMVTAADPTSGEQLKTAILKTQPGSGVPQVHPAQWKEMLAELKSSGQADYEGASGDVNFDEKGEVLSNVAEWTITNGKITPAANDCWTAQGVPCP